MRYLKTYESIPFNPIFFTNEDVHDISDVFQDISDKYNLVSENTGRHGTFRIKLYNLYSKVITEIGHTPGGDDIYFINICIYSDEFINQFIDLDSLINRYKQWLIYHQLVKVHMEVK